MAVQDRLHRNMKEITDRKIKKRVDGLVNSLTNPKDAYEVVQYLSHTPFGRAMRDHILRHTDVQSEDLQETLQYLTVFLGSFTGEAKKELIQSMRITGLDEVITNYSDKMEKMRTAEFLKESNWDYWNVSDHWDYLSEQDIGYKLILGKPSLHRTISDMIGTARDHVYIFCGDGDFINTPAGDDLELGMHSGEEWKQIYKRASKNKIDVRILMDVSTWIESNAEEIQETGVKVKVNNTRPKIRGGSTDSKVMYLFVNGNKDPKYKKILATSQRKLASMFYLGYQTHHPQFVENFEQEFLQVWDSAPDMDKVMGKLVGYRNYTNSEE